LPTIIICNYTETAKKEELHFQLVLIYFFYIRHEFTKYSTGTALADFLALRNSNQEK